MTLHDSPGSKRGQKWEAANGTDIVNLGEKRCIVDDETGSHGAESKIVMHFQVADVTKKPPHVRGQGRGHGL